MYLHPSVKSGSRIWQLASHFMTYLEILFHHSSGNSFGSSFYLSFASSLCSFFHLYCYRKYTENWSVIVKKTEFMGLS